MKKLLLLFIFCSFTKMTFAQSKNQVSIGAKYHYYSLTNAISSFNPYGFSLDYFRNLNEKSAIGLEIEAIFPRHFNFTTRSDAKLTLNYRRYPIRKERVKFFYEGGISVYRSVISNNGLTYSSLSNWSNPSQATSNKKYTDYSFPYFNLKIGGEIKVFKNFTVLPKIMYQFSRNYNFFSPILGIGYTF